MNEWTQAELAMQANRQLAATRGSGTSEPGSAAISERTVRYYRTQALLDPPSAFRGRKPLFGERHLRQLLAVRQLQSSGWTLQQIRDWLSQADAAAIDAIVEQPLQAARLVPPRTLGGSGLVRAARAAWSHPVADVAMEEAAFAFRTAGAAARDGVSTTRLADGIYLLIDSEECGDLDLDQVGAAISRAAERIRSVTGAAGRDASRERTRRREEDDD